MVASICSEQSSVAGDLEGTAAATVNVKLDLGFREEGKREGAGEQWERGLAAGGLLIHEQGRVATRGAGARRRHDAREAWRHSEEVRERS